ncbi:uncharacterized protein LOC130934132 [Arachis stenosperma]|uniref:uncharacterized protein LOC130934132 n=1 Tax=Arachis stenosperma TaxID=217475 RepID=UPI0025AC8954|nr:uncharacterized protein LOC130934132 [Arachis stenosperma]
MKALSEPLRRWHKQHFENMVERIKKLEEEIRKVDDMVSSGRYDETTEARRRALVSCCEKWYLRQEMYWKQMSRSRHANEMDRNTRYIHNIASARRRNNRIEALVLNRRLVRNQARIKTAVRDFYKCLYHQEASPKVTFRDGLVHRLEREEAENLEALPSAKEVKEAVWDCESSKASGSDGYNMHFIKKCWDEIGTEFTAAVMDFFQTVRLPAEANVTWVALAPKFIGAKEIKDLRPISMVGCVYKKNASVIIKLDFQKAYDRVKWCFVDTVLEKMGFGRTWRAWVRECVTSASISIMVNGLPSKPFKMERGLHQGNPLSPFLFVLVVDELNRMIGEAVRNGRISPLLVGRDNIELSHLQFSYDTILFCPPEEETLRNYQRLLRCFEMMSDLSINFEKSNLIPVNCSSEWANRMCQLLGCQEAALPMRYLGISLGANSRLVKTWKPVLDKMPNAVVRRIISLQRRFFWEKDDGRPGMALVKWELIQAPKKQGGLGVGDAEETLEEELLTYKFTKEIWKGLVPPRVELFAWFVLVGRVNTKDRLSVVCLDLSVWTDVGCSWYLERAFRELEMGADGKREAQVLATWILLNYMDYLVMPK